MQSHFKETQNASFFFQFLISKLFDIFVLKKSFKLLKIYYYRLGIEMLSS